MIAAEIIALISAIIFLVFVLPIAITAINNTAVAKRNKKEKIRAEAAKCLSNFQYNNNLERLKVILFLHKDFFSKEEIEQMERHKVDLELAESNAPVYTWKL